ncbi:MAG: twin-arginine translocase TatA/TatE family subunit [Bdellovibrionaceae bacterium]|nr:twin-arginine translocase TatA/TatE family subunit [Pseudobdellovibrionaceae bacterium]
MNLGFTELLLIAGIALLLFGPSRLPGLGKSIGEAIRGFKKGLNEDETITEARPVNDQISFQNQNRNNLNANQPSSNTEQKTTEKTTHS